MKSDIPSSRKLSIFSSCAELAKFIVVPIFMRLKRGVVVQIVSFQNALIVVQWGG